jgi:hypothetical protein
MTDGISPQIHKIRVAFNKDLFVERREELGIARQWQTSNRRVLTITSPPANGKTWFLTHYQQVLQESGELVFTMKVDDFLLPGALGERELDDAALQIWSLSFVAQLQEECDSIPIPEQPKFENVKEMLQWWAGQVTEHYGHELPVYLFLDDGDEPSPKAWKLIERQILEPILAHPNWRLILALRQSQRLYSYLLRQTEKRFALQPLPSSIKISQQGQEQLKKLISQSQKPTPSLAEILAIVPDYNWVHLGLNYFLFLEACYQSTEQQGPAGNDLLKRGIMALTPLDDIDEILKHLQSISQLPPEWAVEELATRLGNPLSTVWETVQTLQDYMLITNIDNSYQITPGVQEFVRSLTPIRLRIRIDKDINEFAGNEFISDLSSVLAVDSERIQLVSIERGSVTITLDIPQDNFIILLRMFIAQDDRLKKLRLLEIEPIVTYGVSLNEEMQHGLATENKNRLSHQKLHEELHQLMENSFNLAELQVLCFDLGIKCENFEPGISLRIIRIIEHCERNGHLARLLNYLGKKRPNITWPTIN